LGIRADVPTAAGGDAPALFATLRGLRFEGDADRRDVSLGGSDLAELPDEVLRLAVGLLRSASGQAGGQARSLLELLGLGADGAIPRLPVAEMLQEGLPALQRWCDGLVRDTAALQAWIARFAEFVAASLPPARAPVVAADQVTWTLASGTKAGLIIRARPGPGSESVLELGGFAELSVGGPPPAAARLETIVLRTSVGGAHPTAVGLPRLSLTGRLGPAPAATGADIVAATATGGLTTAVRALKIGLELSEDRRARFVLAAENVRMTVGGRTDTYPVLDLTNADALVAVAGAVVDDVVDALMDRLGPAAAQARIALGLDAPPAAWPVALVSIFDLMARPIESVLGYHQRVLAQYAAGYPRLPEAMAALLNAGAAVAASGAGTDVDPWIVAFAGGIGLAAWKTDAGKEELHFGLAVTRRATDLGGSCPRVTFSARVELTRIDLDTLQARALGAVVGTITFGARGGIPLRIGTASGAIIADEIGLRLAFVDGRLTPGLVAPGLAAEIEGDAIPFALPTVDAAGAFVGDVPWPALERLCGALLENAGPIWARELSRLFGWCGGQTPRLSLAELLADPLPALQSFAGRTPLDDLIGILATMANGPAAGLLPRGVTLGMGSTATPLTIPLHAVDGSSPAVYFAASGLEQALGIEVFRPAALVALLTGASPTLSSTALGAQLSSILTVAAEREQTLHDALRGRPNLAAGLGALADRFAVGDAMVRAELATFAGATTHEVAVGHGALDSLDLAALTGQAVDEQTLLVTLGPDWSGVDSRAVIDLSTAGLPAAAFDVSRLESEPGPWVVRLPSRRDATTAAGEEPTAAQAARLSRAIAAVVTRMQAAAAVKIVALGGAGHAARLAAATAAGVTHLVTLGTAHGGIDLDVLDDGPAAQALQMLAALLPEPGARTELPAASLGRDCVAPLIDAYRAGDRALDDLAPPPVAMPALPAAVSAHAIAGRVGASGAQAAVSALVARVLQSAYENEELARTLRPAPGAPVLGLGTRIQGGDDVVVGVDAQLDLWRPDTAQLDPVVVVRVEI
ncbi:MAG: hypothetical protein OEW65_08185, partial [Thermoleophilia bacterium]|nr:hypothetical protein [Thermoleophilia bacterium]